MYFLYVHFDRELELQIETDKITQASIGLQNWELSDLQGKKRWVVITFWVLFQNFVYDFAVLIIGKNSPHFKTPYNFIAGVRKIYIIL